MITTSTLSPKQYFILDWDKVETSEDVKNVLKLILGSNNEVRIYHQHIESIPGLINLVKADKAKSNVKTYTKKKIPVDALQFVYTPEGLAELKEFCGSALIATGKSGTPYAQGWAQIGTLEDGGVDGSPQVKHVAQEGDYIVRGTEGEFWPVKKSIFEHTYELTEEIDE